MTLKAAFCRTYSMLTSPAQPEADHIFLLRYRRVKMHKVEIQKHTRVFDDFWKIDELIVSHQRSDGTMSPAERRLIFERGDCVAVMLYSLDTNAVVIVNQFTVPSLVGRRRDDPATDDGWMTEVVSGMLDEGETPEQAAIRETLEETGYKIRDPVLISRFFPSPRGTSERVFLYFAEVREADRIGRGGGLEGEDIKVVHLSTNELFAMLNNRQIEDPKLAIAAYWLKDHLSEARKTPAAAPAPLAMRSGPLSPSTVKYAFKDRPSLIIGYKTGSIDNVQDVDAWVNPENTDMIMDRPVGNTLSARIRYLGANKNENGVIVEDTIQESLRRAIGKRADTEIGTVVATDAGMLGPTHHVKRIFHVATVNAGPGEGAGGGLRSRSVGMLVENVLKTVDHENSRLRSRMFQSKQLDSIIIPVGASTTGLPAETAAEEAVSGAIAYLRDVGNSTLKEIYFLAVGPRDKAAFDRAIDKLRAEGVLAPEGKHDHEPAPTGARGSKEEGSTKLKREAVEFAVSNPSFVKCGVPFLVDAWAFLPEDRETAVGRAREPFGKDTRFRSGTSEMVMRGAKLKIELQAAPWSVEPAFQTMVWTGHVTNTSFRVRPDADVPNGIVHAVCKISLRRSRICEIHFDLAVGKTQGDIRITPAKRLAGFASYASKDRSRVLATVQGLEKFVDVFMDVRNLKAGAAYPTRLLREIDSSDVLYLFWSEHAQQSEWVDKEWRYGFEHRGIDFIDPVPLVDPRRVPPPPELGDQKHFNDWTLAFLEYEKAYESSHS
jgi:nudix-type nucleoside diphosphatase (YffH/AdpP family)